MDNKTRLAQMQEVRSHPKTERKSKQQIMNMITVDQETLMRMIAQAVEAEREACAKVCEDNAWRRKKIAVETQNKKANAAALEAYLCAEAIRARSNT
jgi:hypothetical protein